MTDPDPGPGESGGSAADAVVESTMLQEVREGLTGEQKELSPKYFYDHRGSELFERITELPEYYLTRDELEILEGDVREWIRSFEPLSLVELGAGSARKTRVLLDAMLEDGGGRLFVPVDVSTDFLEASARRLRDDYPSLAVEPAVADISRSVELDVDLARPTLFALLGSTVGNFPRDEAVGLLRRIRALMTSDDAFLMGADLRPGPRKPVERLEAAYDDPEGITARFNKNVLRVLNRELGTDFDLDGFEHRAFYDSDQCRVEMHLVARRRQVVRLPDGHRVVFRAGESVRTEVSCKYDHASVATLFERAGLELSHWLPGRAGRYAMALGCPRAADAGQEEAP